MHRSVCLAVIVGAALLAACAGQPTPTATLTATITPSPNEAPTPTPSPSETPTALPEQTQSPTPIPSLPETAVLSPTVPAVEKTKTPPATVVPAETPTARPEVHLSVNKAAAFAGPGNFGYETVAQIQKDTPLTPLGRFGDFVKVEWIIDGKVQTGFIVANQLKDLPANLAELSVDEVPWRLVKNYTANGPLKEQNPGGGYTSKAVDRNIKLSGPFEVFIQMEGIGENNAILLHGREVSAGEPWWKGVLRVEVGLGQNRGELFVHLRDGSGIDSIYPGHFAPPQDGVVRLRFDQAGKTLRVLDSTGLVLRITNVPSVGQFPDGLFPQGITLIELSSGPTSQMIITKLQVLAQPDGRYVEATPTTVASKTPTPEEELMPGGGGMTRKEFNERQAKLPPLPAPLIHNEEDVKRFLNETCCFEQDWGGQYNWIQGEYGDVSLDGETVVFKIKTTKGGDYKEFRVSVRPDWTFKVVESCELPPGGGRCTMPVIAIFDNPRDVFVAIKTYFDKGYPIAAAFSYPQRTTRGPKGEANSVATGK